MKVATRLPPVRGTRLFVNAPVASQVTVTLIGYSVTGSV